MKFTVFGYVESSIDYLLYTMERFADYIFSYRMVLNVKPVDTSGSTTPRNSEAS